MKKMKSTLSLAWFVSGLLLMGGVANADRKKDQLTAGQVTDDLYHRAEATDRLVAGQVVYRADHAQALSTWDRECSEKDKCLYAWHTQQASYNDSVGRFSQQLERAFFNAENQACSDAASGCGAEAEAIRTWNQQQAAKMVAKCPGVVYQTFFGENANLGECTPECPPRNLPGTGSCDMSDCSGVSINRVNACSGQ